MVKLTAKKLKEGIEDYFADISRVVELKEKVPTGIRDSSGHEIYDEIVAVNGKGAPVMVEEWLVPPSIIDLQNRLGLTVAEWEQIKADEKTGPLAMAAEVRVERYLRRELLLRPNKAIKGVMLTLQNDFGFGGGEEEDDSSGGLEDLLKGGRA